MNERIRELMLEVGFVGYGEDLGSYNIPVPAFNSRMEKFAESIILECVACCGSQADKNNLLKHFGIES